MATSTLDLSTALQHHRSGRPDEAERMYRQLIDRRPDYIDAMNMLGSLLYEQGRQEEALAWFQKVLTFQKNNPDAHNSVGVVLKALNRFEEAAAAYRQALELRPDHPEVLNNLGNALRQLLQFDEAIASYRQALELKPDYAEAHNNLGAALKDQGNLEDAIVHYRQSMILKPNYAEAHHNLATAELKQGNVEVAIEYFTQAIALKSNYYEAYNGLGSAYQQQKEWETAISHHQQAIAIKSDYPEAYHGLANALQQSGKFDDAMTAYESAIRLRPTYPEAYNNYGNALQEQRRYDEAAEQYRKALELFPFLAEAYSNLGSVQKEQKKYDEAIANFEKAIELKPHYAEVHNNLGNAYQDLGRLEDAIACYKKALELRPEFAEIHSNVGNMLQSLGQFEEAFEHFDKAVSLQPDFAGAYNNRGIALRNWGKELEALKEYEKALECKPEFVEAKWNIALTQLYLGQIDAGFAGYEERLEWSRFKEQNLPRPYDQPRWDGSDLQGKTIFVYAEQGMGDTIQFIRYLPMLRDRGARVIFEGQPPLKNLLENFPGIDRWINQGEAAPDAFDTHVHLMSLPHLLGTRLETIPSTIPYIQISDEAKRSVSLGDPDAQLKIGFVWSGNTVNPYNRLRAIPLDYFLTLAEIPGVKLYSLQKDRSIEDAESLQTYSSKIVDLSPQLTDFVVTAAFLEQLDLIISVDTSVTHLAGALNRPVLLLLPSAPDWRWMEKRNDSPWYPSIEILRQTNYGSWAPVFETLHQKVLDRLALPDSQAVQETLNSQLQALSTKTYAPQLVIPVVTAPAPAPQTATTPSQPHPPELRRAISLNQVGQTEAAKTLCEQIVKDHPKLVDAWQMLALINHHGGNRNDAIAYYRKVLALDPNHCDTYNNLAVALQETGRLDDALAHYEKALILRPEYADAHNNYANALREKKRLDDAISHYRQAIALKPTYADAYNNLGLVYFDLEQFEEAAECYRGAIARRPNYPQAHNHLGNALKELGQFDEAIEHYREALRLNPSNAKALNNWGNVYRDRGDLETAIGYYDRAITIDANFAEGHWNKALTLLISGDLKNGFKEYEWRWQVKGPTFRPMRPFPGPVWDGSPLNGKTIFLHSEQGIGDVIQFVRYVPLVAQRGGRVILECHAPLVSLLRSLPGVAEIVSFGDPNPTYDVHYPLLSLPSLLGITADTVPNDIPYIPIPTSNSPRLPAPRTSHPSILKIGIVWSGNPQNPYNRTRAVPLNQLLTLSDIPGVELYSLQKEPSETDNETLKTNPHVHDLRHLLTDFVSTSVLIQQLDLVISIDTSVTHLAGALGQKTWLLLPFAPDWRWMLDRSDSPWYPSVTIFRQPEYGDWESVIAQVHDRLTGHPIPAKPIAKKVQKPIKKSRPQPDQQPQTPDPRVTEAIQAYEAKDYATAERLCRSVLQQHPQSIEAVHVLGVVLSQQQQFTEAIAHFQTVLNAHPEFGDAWGNLANVYQQQEQWDLAISHYQKAIALQPNFADAYYNLALTFQGCDRLEDALNASEQGLRLKPDFADAQCNHGFLLRRLGRLDDAIAHYRRAIELRPDWPEAHKNLGHALLLKGDLPEGFAQYEWRRQQSFWTERSLTPPLWDGADLTGKTILIHAEQGLGDTLQFIRYAKLLKLKGAQVIAEVQPALVSLIETCEGIDQVIPQDAPLPEIDVHAPLLSLPHLLGTELSTIPAETRYLTVPPTAPQTPFDTTNSHLKVGLVWAGNPNHKNDRYRSLPPEQLRSLIDLPNLTFYSLQKDHPLPTDWHGQVIDLQSHLTDFSATAAIVAELDLIITVDTSVAHLAGALGKPVWVMLAYAPDWRWMLERTDSPWYPTLRLFRQAQWNHWESVITQIRQALLQDLLHELTPSQPTAIALSWPLSPHSDATIYGINYAIALQASQAITPIVSCDRPLLTDLPPLQRHLFNTVASSLDSSDSPIHLHWLSDRTKISLNPHTIAIAHLEHPLSKHQRTLAQQCDRVIALSSWNAKILRQSGISSPVVLPGIDPSLFYPASKFAQRSAHLRDRFVIFVRGENSVAQGTDLAIAAFQRFQSRHPEALLLTTHAHPDLQNLAPNSVLTLESLTYWQLGAILRESDVALFPSRCEPSANPWAMASLACGIPTLLSANTGHLEWTQQNIGYSLHAQRPVTPVNGASTEGWGESDCEEILEVLEHIYRDRRSAQHRAIAAADFLRDWTWERQVQRLLKEIQLR